MTMPDPTPQEVVEARERLTAIANQQFDNGLTHQENCDIRTVLALLDEAERVLEPFAEAAAGFRPDDLDTMRPAIVQAGCFRATRTFLLKLKGPDHG